MKSKIALFLILLIPFVALAQVTPQEPPDDNNLGPAMLIMSFIFFMGIVAITLVLLLLLLLVIAVAYLLMLIGLLSHSILTGVYQRSFAKGALRFTHSVFVMAGITVGASIALAMKAILQFELATGVALLIGMVAGGITGGLFSGHLLKVARALLQKVISR